MDLKLVIAVWILIPSILFKCVRTSDSANDEEAVEDGKIRRDYCSSEHFETRCASGSLLVVHKAIYGRMRSGRCITQQFEEAGRCQADVTTYLSARCTGRQNCTIPVGVMNSISQPCHKDFSMYLEVTHECVPVPMGSCADNQKQGTISVSNEGYLAVSPALLAHSGPCHWNFSVEGGRKLRFTLVTDLASSVQAFRSVSTSGDSGHMYCETKLYFREGTETTPVNLCPSQYHDQETLYSTISPVVHLEGTISPNVPISLGTPPILIHYKVFGCSDIKPPEGATVRHSPQGAVIICNQSLPLETWYLTCKNNEWVGGFTICPKAPATTDPLVPSLPRTGKDLQNGIVLAVLVGVILGVVVGACMLCVIFVVRRSKRRTSSRNRASGDELQYDSRLRGDEACDVTYPSLLRHEKGALSPSDYEHVCANACPVSYKSSPGGGAQLLNVQVGKSVACLRQQSAPGVLDGDCKQQFERTLLSPERIKLAGYQTKMDGGTGLASDPMTYYDLEPQIPKQATTTTTGLGRPEDARIVSYEMNET